MIVQIALGSGLMLVSILLAGFSFWLMEHLMGRLGPWITREPHQPKLMLALCAATLWILGLLTAGVWLWAFTLRALGIFMTMESAVYFALTAFTTLGFGDVLLPQEWRLLGGMAAANGLLNVGLLTAVLVDTLRHVRLGQVEHRRRKG
jgi:hypothetical protein